MRAFMDRVLTQLKEYFGKMTRRNRIMLAILSVVVVALAVIAVVLLSRTDYETLYKAQSDAEAGLINEALLEMGEQTKVEGLSILVPKGRANELRVKLAAQGVIGSEDVDYSLLESASDFTVTDSHAKKIYEAQRAREITEQLRASDRIVNARVTLNMGEDSPFVLTQGSKDATAAVMLTVRDNALLTKQETRAIAEIVRNSIPGIRYENITISDSNLVFYPVSEVDTESEDPEIEIDSRIALQNLLSQQIQAQLEQLLTPIFGMSGVAVSASVKLNFDKKVTESVEFAPPVAGELDGIVRSISEIREAQKKDEAAEGIPGTDENGMGTVQYPYGSLGDGEIYEKAVRERNYEINETREVIEHEQGFVESLGIGVLIDSILVGDSYNAKVANLVSKTFGIHPDYVAVESIPFSQHETTPEVPDESAQKIAELEQRKELLQTIIKWAVILLLGLAFMMLIRMIVKTMKPVPEPILVEGAIDGGVIDYIADDSADKGGYEDKDDDEEITDVSEYEEEVELNKKSAGLEQIERFIDRDPGSVAQLLRNWLSDE